MLAVSLMVIPPTNAALITRISVLAALALCFPVAILKFPWIRFDERLFLVVSIIDMALIAIGVAVTGGPTSRYQMLFMLIVIFAAYFYRMVEAALVTALTGVALCVPLLYDAPSPSWTVPFTAGNLGVIILVAAVIKETVLETDRVRNDRECFPPPTGSRRFTGENSLGDL